MKRLADFLSVGVLGVAVVSGFGERSAASTMTSQFSAELRGFSGTWVASALTVTHSHSFSLRDTDPWTASSRFYEVRNLTSADTVLFSGSVQHAVAPDPGEPNSGGWFPWGIFVNAASYSVGNHLLWRPGMTSHGDHFDHFLATVSFNVAPFPALDQISGYTATLIGKHTVSAFHSFFASSMTLNGTDAFASIGLIQDDEGSTDLAVAAFSIAATDILAAHIHGADDSVIYDLGGGAYWTSLPEGSVRQVHDALITDSLEDLVVHVHTTQGDFTGTLALVPEPSTLALLYCGLGLLVVRRRMRRDSIVGRVL